MLLYAIWHNFNTLIINFYSLLPSLPPMPENVDTIIQSVLNAITDVVGLFRLLYGDILFTAMIAIVFGLYAFKFVYHSVMWVIKKIPMLSIR